MLMLRPISSSAAYPNVFSAAGLTVSMWPPASIVMTAATADWRIALNFSASISFAAGPFVVA